MKSPYNGKFFSFRKVVTIGSVERATIFLGISFFSDVFSFDKQTEKKKNPVLPCLAFLGVMSILHIYHMFSFVLFGELAFYVLCPLFN